MEQNIIAVSQVNEYIKFLLDRDELLANLCVRGEISNYKVYPSAIITLRSKMRKVHSDASCSAPVRSACASNRKNGMQVVAYGRVTVLPARRRVPALLQRR